MIFFMLSLEQIYYMQITHLLFTDPNDVNRLNIVTS